MESLTRDLGKGQKAGEKKLKIINECLIISKKTDWKFENGILYHCSKDKSIGGEEYQKWHSTQETQSRSRGGRAVSQVKGLETGKEQLKLKRFTSRVRKGGNRDIWYLYLNLVDCGKWPICRKEKGVGQGG